ncbi:cysteine synthase B, partial [Pseudomonas syringae]|nr:cysteine synthase B [Pseudomonas syringae]
MIGTPRSLDCEDAMTLQYQTIADCVGNTPLVRLQ